jgi:dimeric dUTPase (all-alpha-NTP-PPase superfamily)
LFIIQRCYTFLKNIATIKISLKTGATKLFDGLNIDQNMLKSGSQLKFAELDELSSVMEDVKKGDYSGLADAFNEEIGGAVDYHLWAETVKIQKQFNDQVAIGWEADKDQLKFDYWMATLDEVTEVLNSRHWKWWKNPSQMNNVDWDNVIVELVDIFHFMLSMGIQHKSHDMIFTSLVAVEADTNRPPIKDETFFKDFWEHMIMATYLKSLPLLIVKWVEFWYRAGGNANDLFKEYRLKAALNKVRQEFGYGAKNTYFKMWPSPDNPSIKVEDNVAAKILTKDLTEINNNTINEIESVLQKYYLERVAI